MYPFVMTENEHDDVYDQYYYGIVGLISIPITALFIMDEMGGDFVNRAEIQIKFKCNKINEL